MSEENHEKNSMEILNTFIRQSKGGVLEFWLMIITVALICIKYILLTWKLIV